MTSKSCFLFLGLCFLFLACEDVIYSPKPRGFPKVNYPEKKYVSFEAHYCDFTFEIPDYSIVQQDTLFFDEKPAHPCWFDVYFPNFNARIHCSYFPIDENNDFDKLTNDAFVLANKHNLKANYIDDLVIQKPDGVGGIVFNIEGPVASPFQFYLSDSTSHFLRGALYFNTQTRPDSLKPIIEFVKTDIMHMINTFEWKIIVEKDRY